MKPHFTFAGFSGSGKTTLATEVVSILAEKGYKIAALKHDGHNFEMDKEGKDTYKYKKAGAKAVAISSAHKYAVLADSDRRLKFCEMMTLLPEDIDIVIGEGFKEDEIPKIVVHRKANGKERACLSDKFIIAAATDVPEDFPEINDIFDINDVNGIANYIETKFLK